MLQSRLGSLGNSLNGAGPAAEVGAKLRFDDPADNLPAMSIRVRQLPAGFIEPSLPSPADRPPSGANWIHEIKHDGYRLMARRDSVGIRLMTR
jgi:bifunctional non-homologous end joining protein LigD